MAEGFSKCFLLSLLALLTTCSSGTLLGFSYIATEETESSSFSRTLSFLRFNKVPPSQIRFFIPLDHRDSSTLFTSGVSVDLYLNENLVKNLVSSQSSAISWLKSHLQAVTLHVNVNSVVVSCNNDCFDGQNGMLKLLSTLKSVRSVLGSFRFREEMKVSVAFPASFVEKLKSTKYELDLQGLFCFIKKIGSFVIVEANTDRKLSVEDEFVQSMIRRFHFSAYVFPCNDVPMILTSRNPNVQNLTEVTGFTKVRKSLENNKKIANQMVEEQKFHSSRRELGISFKTTSHEATYAPTTSVLTPSVAIPSSNPTPNVVTVPSTNPVTPSVPAATPVTVPSTNPNNPMVPITNPVTTPATPVTVPGAQPVTNPVTTYPAPTGGVPVSTPVVPPAATTNAPAVTGQSWCVAKIGASQTSLQSGLDYACGNGADCSQIQQGASCYNPNSLQSHASYAFNSYYQKNPAPTSCDFGGTATLINTNPSTGSCLYPSTALSSTSPTTPGTGVSGSINAPAVLNSSSPASGFPTGFGSDVPPNFNSSASASTRLQPFIRFIVLVSAIVDGMIILGNVA